jgi:hypothetical protein
LVLALSGGNPSAIQRIVSAPQREQWQALANIPPLPLPSAQTHIQIFPSLELLHSFLMEQLFRINRQVLFVCCHPFILLPPFWFLMGLRFVHCSAASGFCRARGFGDESTV